MPKDRRRGRRRHHGASRPSPVSQQPGQPVASSRQVPTERASPLAKTPLPQKQPVLANPHLGRDLRNIAIVTALMVLLLVILHFVL